MPAGTVAREPDQVDVCVIGSGASGAIIASELAHRGLRILVLETGIAPRTGDSLRSMEPAWETAFVRTGGGRLAQTGRPWSACALGGGTSIFAGITFRLREVDFHASPHTADDALDPTWPFRYADLRKWYDAVERAIGVARAHGMDPIEPEAAPPRLPPHPYSAAGALLAESGLRLGMRPFPTPLAINSIPYGGRPACHRCGPCNEHVCPTGAKADAAGLFLSPLAHVEELEVATMSRALRIILASAHQAAGVEWLNLRNHRRHVTRAKVIVLAANAIQSAAILLRSADRRAPRGLGNRYDMVGRGLSFKVSTYLSGYVRHRRNPGIPAGPHSTVSFTDHYLDAEAPLGLGGLIYEASPEDRDVHQGKLKVRLHCLAADQPMPGNRIRLAAAADADGAARLVIEYRTHTIDTARLRYLARRAEQVLREVGATEIAEQESGYQAGSRHLHGTCRAGSDPRNSVVDSWGRVHDTDNVYVVDGGFFPYAGGVNPTFTIQANALRISAEITRRLGAGSAANSAEPAMHPMPTEEGHHV